MMRWVVGSSLYFRFLVVALAVGTLTFGATRVRNMPVDVFPEFAPPFVEVQTEGPGMSTEEIESLITIPLEQSLNSTPGLDVMRSKSVPGVSAITLVFKRGTDSLEARQLVNERLAIAMRSIPTSAGIPWILQPLSATSRVMKIGLSVVDVLAHRPLDDQLLDDPVAANGGARGGQRGDLGRPVQAAPAASRPGQAAGPWGDAGAGDGHDVQRVRLRPSEVHGRGEDAGRRIHRDAQPAAGDPPHDDRHGPPQLAQVRIDGTPAPLALGDIGATTWGHQPLIGDAVINDQPGLLMVVESSRGRTRSMSRTAWTRRWTSSAGASRCPDRQSHLPSGGFIELSIHNLRDALLLGTLLVVLVLVAFLFQWRAALISLVAIPLSLMAAAVVLYLQGGTINTMVLAGFVIAVGVVVDDAIIDIENIVRRLRQARAAGSEASGPRSSSRRRSRCGGRSSTPR